MVRRLHILMLLVVALMVAPDSSGKSRGKPRRSDGGYQLKVAGFYYGQGTAQVSGGSGVHLSFTLIPEDGGRSGAVDVTLPLVGNRFVGDSTFLGAPIHVEGRIDAPDDEKERTIRGVRLICRLRTATLKYASIVGFVPELANTRDAIDDNGGEGDDRNKGKGS
jgi:hypothetical protein